jgi:hypothetical protein
VRARHVLRRSKATLATSFWGRSALRPSLVDVHLSWPRLGPWKSETLILKHDRPAVRCEKKRSRVSSGSDAIVGGYDCRASRRSRTEAASGSSGDQCPHEVSRPGPKGSSLSVEGT